MIVYNRSHVPAIMEYSRTDEDALGATAHEVLREISSRTPEVLKAHVQEICKDLQEEAPSATKSNDPETVDDLRACSSFASKFPKDLPQDRNFIQSLTGFALHGKPAVAAKYAVTILMTTSKKEMIAKDLVTKCTKDFGYGRPGFMSRLATLSQLMLLAPHEVDDESDAIIDIAIKEILLEVRSPTAEASNAYTWSHTCDEECEAKCWALKILVNRLRSHDSPETLADFAKPVYNLLETLVTKHGELVTAKNTPPKHKSRLRLQAARLYLKLSTKKSHDALLTPSSFNGLALVAQDPHQAVRRSFLQRLRKYLAKTRLSQRFYAIPFLLAYEPSLDFKLDVTTWIRSRAAYLPTLTSQNGGKPTTVLESVFARLISLIAHHPDYSSEPDDLVYITRYIVFYLQNVANVDNLSLIFHIVQRIKQTRDAITATEAANEALYTLSDLAQLTIRRWEEEKGWSIDVIPIKIRLPKTLFTEVKGHAEALSVAERNFLPEDIEEGVDKLVKASLRKENARSKKRKSDVVGNGQGEGDAGGLKKKAKLPIRKAPVPKERKATKTPKPRKKKEVESSDAGGSGERRRSRRVASGESGKYKERDDEDDDEEMVDGVAQWIYEDEGGDSVEPDPEPGPQTVEISSNVDDSESDAGGLSGENNPAANGDGEEEDPPPPAKTTRGKPAAKARKGTTPGSSPNAARSKHTSSATSTSSPKASKGKKSTAAAAAAPSSKTKPTATGGGGLKRPTRATKVTS